MKKFLDRIIAVVIVKVAFKVMDAKIEKQKTKIA